MIDVELRRAFEQRKNLRALMKIFAPLLPKKAVMLKTRVRKNKRSKQISKPLSDSYLKALQSDPNGTIRYLDRG